MGSASCYWRMWIFQQHGHVAAPLRYEIGTWHHVFSIFLNILPIHLVFYKHVIFTLLLIIVFTIFISLSACLWVTLRGMKGLIGILAYSIIISFVLRAWVYSDFTDIKIAARPFLFCSRFLVLVMNFYHIIIGVYYFTQHFTIIILPRCLSAAHKSNPQAWIFRDLPSTKKRWKYIHLGAELFFNLPNYCPQISNQDCHTSTKPE